MDPALAVVSVDLWRADAVVLFDWLTSVDLDAVPIGYPAQKQALVDLPGRFETDTDITGATAGEVAAVRADSDQWSTFGTQQFVPTTREGQYTLDEFLGNKTDLPLRDHATDTHGATLINFSLFDLVGKRLTPRMGI